MAKLVWGAAGTHLYDTGVDRGVLFPIVGSGVAWNGLIAVNEAPSGGEPQPYHFDGFKYLNLAAAEEFEATLEAYSSPVEFAPSDGTTQIWPGLSITQQPRKPFGLSYRTLIGNDVSGQDLGYKLHLVYNALASPSARNNASVNSSPEPSKLSWGITTNPPILAAYKPSAHLVIDSTKTVPSVLVTLENLIYGVTAINPRLPTQQEIVALFA